ncbi:MAG: hypothetical protein ACI4GO_07560, partial [Hominenteromicrobium sp.]
HTYSVMMHHLFAIFLIQSAAALVSRLTGLLSTFDLDGYKSWVYYLYVPQEPIRLFYAAASIAMVLAGSYLFEKVKEKSGASVQAWVCRIKRNENQQ